MTGSTAASTREGSPRRLLGGRARLIGLARHVDARGELVPLTFADIGFPVARAFVVTAPDGSIRGGHAHAASRQLLLRVRGTIRVELRTAEDAEVVLLDAESPALVIEPGVWATQTYVGDDAALVVFSDTAYDPADYIQHADRRERAT